MTPHQHKIAQALELIREVRQGLDLRTEVCPCCGLTAYANRAHWQRDQTLGALVTKLNRIVRGNDDYVDPKQTGAFSHLSVDKLTG